MRLLLDTHTLLWSATEPNKLGANSVAAIRDPRNERFFSSASIWELAIKIKIGKMSVPGGLPSFLNDLIHQLMLTPLSVRPEHTLALETMDLHHSDPFDRLIVAQALYESMDILSIDSKLDAYGVNRIW